MKYKELIAEYMNGINQLNSILDGISEDVFNYRPSWDGAWTIKEHLIHTVDSETNGFIRIKSIIAQPNTECYVMDEELWTSNLTRKNEDPAKYLQLFSLIRNIVYDLIKDEPEDNWTHNYFIRNYMGEKKEITLDQAIQLYIRHLSNHIDYMNKILKDSSCL